FWSSIKSRAQADERDWENARYDAVTGLPNAFGLSESLKALLPRRRGATEPVAVAVIGVDGFLDLVDFYGREAGDRLLVRLADLIELEAGEAAVFARTGSAHLTLARVGEGSAAQIR